MFETFDCSKLTEPMIREGIKWYATAKEIPDVNQAADFLLEASECLTPDDDPYLWGNIEIFKAEVLEPETLVHYGLSPDATGWYFISLYNEVFQMNASIIREMAEMFLSDLKYLDSRRAQSN